MKMIIQERIYSGGFATLFVIAILTVLILLFVGGLLLTEYVTSRATHTQREGSDSFYSADWGLEDALLRIARNKDFESSGYSPPAEEGSLNVDITGTSTKTITASSTVESMTRKVEGTIGVSDDGVITLQDWKEKTD
jgi:Tfp pilus assembly protein PilX